MRWLVLAWLIACDRPAPPPTPGPCELALDVAPASYTYSGRLTGKTTKLTELQSAIAPLGGEHCTAIVTTDGTTPYPVFVTMIELLEQAGLRTDVGLDRARLAVTARPRGADTAPSAIVVLALAPDGRAYVGATVVADGDITAALRARAGTTELGLAADVSLRYSTIERALRAAHAAGVTTLRLLTDRR